VHQSTLSPSLPNSPTRRWGFSVFYTCDHRSFLPRIRSAPLEPDGVAVGLLAFADDARQHARARPLIACLQGLLAFDHRADEAFVSSGAFAIVKELAIGLGGLRPELLR